MIKLPTIFLPVHKKNLLRVGSKYDGGYILTKEIVEKTNFLLSFGLSFDWQFEEDFLEKKNAKINIHVYDHTIDKRAFLKFTYESILKTILNPFRKVNWSNIFKYFSYIHFFDNIQIIHFQEKVWWNNNKNNSTINKIFERIDDDNIFLKMDIEGSEYRVIEKILNYDEKIVGMAIEFHEVDILYDTWLDLINKIKDKFNIVHIHANNFSEIGTKKIPNAWEITFENKKFFNSITKPSNYSYPIKGIDMPNDPNESDFSFTLS